jgi:hypothetical protein
MNTTNTRQHVHSLVDQLPPGPLAVIEDLLSVMIDPLGYALRNAPIDDEPSTEEEEHAVAGSKEWFKHNPGTPFEDVVTELGFSMEENRIEGDQLL